jgi:hypothetical protein
VDRNRLGILLLAAVVVAIAIIVITYGAWRPKPTIVTDRLCEYVRDQEQMNCVAVVAADEFVHPGAIVAFQPSSAPSTDKVPLPVADVFGSGCLVPGASPEFTAQASKPIDVSIPELNYETNGALEVGADVEIPELYGATIKAGPRWSNVQKVTLSADKAWITQLDENLAIKAVQSCSFSIACVNRIQAQQYRVIATSLVTQGLGYKFFDSSGAVISLDAAAKSEEFTASLGGNSDLKSTTDATLKASAPRVVGVRLLPADIFKSQPVCEQSVLLSASGSATVSIDGGNTRGSFGGLKTEQKPINETAHLAANGAEKSECKDDFERKISGADATALVASKGDGALRFTYDIAAAGGHFVTAAGCPLGQVVGKTGHDTSATAAADLVGTISVLVRSDESPNLQVTWNDMPPDGATMRVVDWRNEPLRDMSEHPIVGAFNASGQGSKNFATRGPGVYRVETRIQLGGSVSGNTNDTKRQTADVSVGID